MTSDPTITKEIVFDLLQRLGAGDPDSIADLFAEHIDWYVPGDPTLPWTGQRHQRRDVADYFRTMWPHFAPGKSTTVLQDVLVDKDAAVVLATFEHTVVTTGIRFSTPVAMHVAVNGREIVKLHLYEDTWLVASAFFAQGPISGYLSSPEVGSSRTAASEGS